VDNRKTRALITGASSGIGRELARVFARYGHNLVLAARNRERLDALAGELRETYGIEVEVLPQDLSVPKAASEIMRNLQEKALQIDVLVNNAGFDVYGFFHDTPMEKERQMIQVNMTALTELTKAVLGGMRERRYGRILNLGSTGSFAPSPYNAVYCATKAYVLSFSEAISEELRGSGVSATALCPGVTKTEFQQRADMTETRILKMGAMEARKVAEAGYRALMRGKRLVVPGLLNKILVYSSWLMPKGIALRIAKALLAKG
jgi:short-subunit dehydrogenase